MSTPSWLDNVANPYKYTEIPGLVDVETGGVGIITQLRTFLVTNLGWTEPSTALFKTPVDSAGRFFDLLCTRISASVMEFRLRNASAVTVFTRRISITTASGTAVRIFAGGSATANNGGASNGAHVIVESLQGSVAATELLTAFLLDVSPCANADISLYVAGNATLSGTSTNDSVYSECSKMFMIDNGATASSTRLRRRDQNRAGGLSVSFVSPSGRMKIYSPLVEANFAGTLRWAGNLPHVIVVDSSVGFGCRRRPSIDTNVRGTFQVLSLATSSSFMRLAARVAD
jgi:hypothetical protein